MPTTKHNPKDFARLIIDYKNSEDFKYLPVEVQNEIKTLSSGIYQNLKRRDTLKRQQMENVQQLSEAEAEVLNSGGLGGALESQNEQEPLSIPERIGTGALNVAGAFGRGATSLAGLVPQLTGFATRALTGDSYGQGVQQLGKDIEQSGQEAFPSAFEGAPNTATNVLGKTTEGITEFIPDLLLFGLGGAAGKAGAGALGRRGFETAARLAPKAGEIGLLTARSLPGISDAIEEGTGEFRPSTSLGIAGAQATAMVAALGVMLNSGASEAQATQKVLDLARAGRLGEILVAGQDAIARGLKTGAAFAGSGALSNALLQSGVNPGEIPSIEQALLAGLESAPQGFMMGAGSSLMNTANLSQAVNQYGKKNVLTDNVKVKINEALDGKDNSNMTDVLARLNKARGELKTPYEKEAMSAFMEMAAQSRGQQQPGTERPNRALLSETPQPVPPASVPEQQAFPMGPVAAVEPPSVIKRAASRTPAPPAPPETINLPASATAQDAVIDQAIQLSKQKSKLEDLSVRLKSGIENIKTATSRAVEAKTIEEARDVDYNRASSILGYALNPTDKQSYNEAIAAFREYPLELQQMVIKDYEQAQPEARQRLTVIPGTWEAKKAAAMQTKAAVKSEQSAAKSARLEQQTKQAEALAKSQAVMPAKLVSSPKLRPNAVGVQIVDKSGQIPTDNRIKLTAAGDASRIEKRLSKTEAPAIRAESQPAETANRKHSFSNTDVTVPKAVANKMLDLGKSIPDSELYIDKNDSSYGRETRAHVTVRYGLDTDNPADLQKLSELAPIKVKMGDVSIFETDKYDVVKVDVDSPELRAANKMVGELVSVPGETHKDYKPHATIAYVKKGEGKKYVGNKALSGNTFEINEINLMDRGGKEHKIKLTGKSAASPKTSTAAKPAKPKAPEATGELRKQAKKAISDVKQKDVWYHSSPDKISAINDGGMFGPGLFFASTPYSLGSGKYVYKFVPEDYKIIRAKSLPYEIDPDESPLVKKFAGKWKVSTDNAFDIISGKANEYDIIDAEIAGEAGWEAQKYAMLLANELGYDGVEGRDEQGTYYLVNAKRIDMVLDADKSAIDSDDFKQQVLIKGLSVYVDDSFNQPTGQQKPGKTTKPAKPSQPPLFTVESLAAKYTAKAVKAGWRLLRSGIARFADWARSMLKQFGAKIGKQLRSMYADLQSFNQRLGRVGGIGGTLKSRIHRAVGKTAEEIKTISDRAGLKRSLSRQSIAAKQAFFEGVRQTRDRLTKSFKSKYASIDEARANLKDFAQVALLPADRHAVLASIISAKQPAQFSRIAERIMETAEARYRKRELERFNDLKKSTEKVHSIFTKDKADLLDGLRLDNSAINKVRQYLRTFESESDISAPEWLIDALDKAVNEKDPKYINPATLETINDSLMFLKAAQTLIKQVTIGGQKQEATAVAHEIREYLRELKSMKQTDETTKFSSLEVINPVSDYLNDGLNFADNFGPTGRKMLYDDLLSGQRESYKILKIGQIELQKTLESVGLPMNSRKLNKFMSEPVLKMKNMEGEIVSISRGEKLLLIVNAQDPESRPELLIAGFTLKKKKDMAPVQVSEEMLQKMEDSLSDNERKIISDLRYVINHQIKDSMNFVHEKLNGYPLTTRDDGMYYPRHRNVAIEGRSVSEEQLIGQGYSKTAITGEHYGSLKGRISNSRAFVIGDLIADYQQAVRESAQYVGFAEPLRNISRVIREPGFQPMVTRKLGEQSYRRIIDRSAILANQASPKSPLETSANKLLGNLAGALLTPASWAKQLASVGAATTEIPAQYIIAGLPKAFLPETGADMLNSSVEAWHRYEYGGGVALFSPTFSWELQQSRGLLMKPAMVADKISLQAIYQGALEQAKAEGKSKEWAVKLFERTVNNTQNTIDPINATAFQEMAKDSVLWKTTTTFQAQRMKFFNVLKRLHRRYGRKEIGLGSAVGGVLATVIANSLWNALIKTAEAKILEKRQKPSDVKKGKDPTFAKEFAGEVADFFNFNPINSRFINTGRNVISLAEDDKAIEPSSGLLDQQLAGLTYSFALGIQGLYEYVTELKDKNGNYKYSKTLFKSLDKAVMNGLPLTGAPTWPYRYITQAIKNREWTAQDYTLKKAQDLVAADKPIDTAAQEDLVRSIEKELKRKITAEEVRGVKKLLKKNHADLMKLKTGIYAGRKRRKRRKAASKIPKK